MATKTIDERERVIELVEELFLTGHRTSWQIYSNTNRSEVSNYDTARRYLAIVQRRLRNRWKNANLEKILRTELQELEMLERSCWKMIEEAETDSPKLTVMQTLLKIKAHKARLLGLDDGHFAVKLEGQVNQKEQIETEAERTERVWGRHTWKPKTLQLLAEEREKEKLLEQA